MLLAAEKGARILPMSFERPPPAPPRWWGVWTLIAVLALSGCAVQHSLTYPVRPSPPGADAGVHPRIATASWYGAERRGHLTSSGEAFNPNELTAASRSLPIGSHVKVTNVTNGRSVVVRINDRGPFGKGRSIDLSRAAAERIGLASKGVGRVEIVKLEETISNPGLWAQ